MEIELKKLEKEFRKKFEVDLYCNADGVWSWIEEKFEEYLHKKQ